MSDSSRTILIHRDVTDWLESLTPEQRTRIFDRVDLLRVPNAHQLGRPSFDQISGVALIARQEIGYADTRRWNHVKELRVGPLRVLFEIHDSGPVLLLGAFDKTNRGSSIYGGVIKDVVRRLLRHAELVAEGRDSELTVLAPRALAATDARAGTPRVEGDDVQVAAAVPDAVDSSARLSDRQRKHVREVLTFCGVSAPADDREAAALAERELHRFMAVRGIRAGRPVATVDFPQTLLLRVDHLYGEVLRTSGKGQEAVRLRLVDLLRTTTHSTLPPRLPELEQQARDWYRRTGEPLPLPLRPPHPRQPLRAAFDASRPRALDRVMIHLARAPFSRQH